MSASRWRDERGLTLPIVALLITTIIFMVSFAVDLGRQRSDRRLAQAGADVVALDMIRVVQGRTLAELTTVAAVMAEVTDALTDSADRNGFENDVDLVVTDDRLPRVTALQWGEVDENDDTFVPLYPIVGVDTDGDGIDDLDEVPTAVQIETQRTTDYFFQPGDKGVTRLAVATEDKTASFALGSRLASVDATDSDLLDNFIGRALGDIDVSAVDYNGLAGASVDIWRLAAELGAGSPDQLAGATFDGPRFFDATADALEAQGDTANASAFRNIGLALDSSTEVSWDQVFDISQGGDGGVAEGTVNLLGLLQATAYVINGNNTINVPGLALNGGLLGLTEVKNLTVTERPIVVTGREGANGDTRQADLDLVYTVNDRALGPLFRVSGTITVGLELAGANGELDDIDCGRPGIDVVMTPKPVSTVITVDLVVRSLGIPVVRATGNTASYSTTGTSDGASFDHPTEFLPNVGSGSMVASDSTSLGLAGASNFTVGQLTLLGVLPLGQSLNSVNTLLNNVFDPLLALIDTRVITRIDRQLGLNIGGADIGAINMTCRSVKLVG